jgi:uncharacterized phage protein gp47/JayE
MIAVSTDRGTINVSKNDVIQQFSTETENCIVDQIIFTGRNEETTTELRSRYKTAISNSMGNNPLWYKNEALKVRGVGYAKIVRPTNVSITNKQVHIYAATQDYQPVSDYVISELRNHFKQNALIGTDYSCRPIENTDTYIWNVTIISADSASFTPDSIRSTIFNLIQEFLKLFNDEMVPGDQPTLYLSRIEGYIISRMYETSYKVVGAKITITQPGYTQPSDMIDLHDGLVATIKDSPQTFIITPKL